MVLLIPVNSYIATKSKEYQVKQMKQKDKRMNLMSEVVQGIKVSINQKKSPLVIMWFFLLFLNTGTEIVETIFVRSHFLDKSKWILEV